VARKTTTMDEALARRRFRFLPAKQIKYSNKFNISGAKYDRFFVLRDFTQNFINLTIQLNTDAITKEEFFRAVILGYLERDPNMVNFVKNYIKKEENIKKRTHDRFDKILKKEESQHDKVEKSMFSGDEINNIFDLIAGEIKDFDLDDCDEDNNSE